MCGIMGFNFQDKNLVLKMIQTLRHRGPDDFGFYIDDYITLGHTRLSIIDLSKRGRQPMSNEDDSIWITYNGEIYNYIELRKELEEYGHEFKSNTDTEVIIHAYEEYGLGFLNKLRGMFALALYDLNKKILILARDPVGKKPIYYYFDGNRFIFASEIKALLLHEIPKKINFEAFYSFLAFQYTIGDQTMFEDVKKVLGGHFLVFDLKNKRLYIDKYWDIKENIINDRDENYFINELRKLLDESARLRLRSDVPVGAFLSGGIDSSTAIAFARNYVDYDFHTFSMGFKYFSELDYARKVAEHLGTIHHEIVIDEKDVIKEFYKVAWHFDEPVGDAAIVANYFLSKEANRYVKVVLAGEAGDELFGGYGNYKTNLKYFVNLKVPKILRKLIGKSVEILPLSIKGNPWINRNVRRLYYLSHDDLIKAHLYTTRGMSDHEILWLLKRKKRIDIYRKAIIPKNVKNPLNLMLALDLKNLLAEKYLMKADKATMANGIEERLILMDKKIVEFSYKIPPDLKIKNGRGKWILRKAGEIKLPKEILWRKKQGFGVPIDYWIRGEMRDIVLQHLEGEFLRKYFDKNSLKYVEEKIKRGMIENYHHALVAWSLFALEVWYNVYFKNFNYSTRI